MPGTPFEILTDRLVLRPPTAADAPDMAAIFGDLRVMRWLGRTEPETGEQILKRATRHEDLFSTVGYGMFLVRRRDTGELVGDCGGMAVALRGPETEIGWRFAPAHWGHGYATEAARAVVRHFFTTTEIDHLIAVTRHTNVASQRVMQRLGMTDRGIGHFYNMNATLYDLSKADWAAAG